MYKYTLPLLLALATPAAYGDAIYTALAPGTHTLAANDDGSSPDTNIGFDVNFYGTTYSSLYVNNNGNFTFGGALGTYTPFGLTSATARPIIAGFFGDVDTRGAGSGLLTYGETTHITDDSIARDAFVGNWLGVGYYSGQANLLNTFQLLLVNRSDTGAGNFDIVYNYGSMQWETGAASGGSGGLGGNSARVGYSAGSGVPGTFYEFDGSGVNGALIDGGVKALRSHSNVDPSDLLYTRTDGRYILQVRGGEVLPPPPTGVPEPSSYAALGVALGSVAFVRRIRK